MTKRRGKETYTVQMDHTVQSSTESTLKQKKQSKAKTNKKSIQIVFNFIHTTI